MTDIKDLWIQDPNDPNIWRMQGPNPLKRLLGSGCIAMMKLSYNCIRIDIEFGRGALTIDEWDDLGYSDDSLLRQATRSVHKFYQNLIVEAAVSQYSIISILTKLER